MTLFLSDDILNLLVGPRQYRAQFVVFCNVLSLVIAVAATFIGALPTKLYIFSHQKFCETNFGSENAYYVKNAFQSVFSHG